MNNGDLDFTFYRTFKHTASNCNSFTVEVGTTGPQGGDSGHGGRTYFKLTGEHPGDFMICQTLKNQDELPIGIEIKLGGDSELKTFTECLKFAVKVLEDPFFHEVQK